MTDKITRFPNHAPKVVFHRRELQPILNVYGKMVMAGEARDYAIGMEKDVAIFAIFKRHAEKPTYRIEKQPALAHMQGQYVIYGSFGQVLKRGRELPAVLRVFDARRFQVIK